MSLFSECDTVTAGTEAAVAAGLHKAGVRSASSLHTLQCGEERQMGVVWSVLAASTQTQARLCSSDVASPAAPLEEPWLGPDFPPNMVAWRGGSDSTLAAPKTQRLSHKGWSRSATYS